MGNDTPGCRPVGGADYSLPGVLIAPAAPALDNAGWKRCLFSLAPLLAPPAVWAGGGSAAAAAAAAGAAASAALPALDLLLALSETPALRAGICAAGCIPPLLALLLDVDGARALRAMCALSALAEAPRAGASCLASEPALAVLLATLQRHASLDMRIGALYVLRRLAEELPAAAAALRRPAMLRQLAALLAAGGGLADEDARLGVVDLLSLLLAGGRGSGGGAAATATAAPGMHRSPSAAQLQLQRAPQELLASGGGFARYEMARAGGGHDARVAVY